MGDVKRARVEQQWDPDRYEREAAFVARLGLPVMDLLAPKEGERILDLGCGHGTLTEKIVKSGCKVLALDASKEMIDAAKARGLDAEVADCQELASTRPELQGKFDAVFSNAALHWMKRNPAGVVAGAWHCLAPGGRFVAECGAHGNVAAVRVALHAVMRKRGVDPLALDPWVFASKDHYTGLLEAQGFVVEEIKLIPRPTPLEGSSMQGWIETFGDSFIKALPEEEQQAAKEEAVELLRPALQDERGGWLTDYVRLRFCAKKPAT
mmetsp:Transcript_51563/g.122650  ORF Transcript_51563/g.122650 Transcript_51563/m.122650 type:complete len:266 (-) Transcript_51563:118-915(-)|eukprot:CAMPEP_0178401162 /NCGR_PEP_ID=MMETSP0689_2-20121128/16160_1 /TAXON_ID=160604 /ORGANISM="Amphidinium massartii, Strain CS-259" /LENGTH=265 /DNA_ID=CAMNT_0020021975 /DNA_START=62 /DNA_END=859 /DNA_ORIENTATION=-